jgi:ankyrin repeat protein
VRTTDSLEECLESAIRHLQPRAVQFLVKQGAKLKSGSYYDPVFVTMVQSINFDDVSESLRRAREMDSFTSIPRILVNPGVDINAIRDGGISPLLSAVKRTNSADVIQVLVDAGVDLYHAGDDGYDAFLFAAIREKLQTLQCLLSYRD